MTQRLLALLPALLLGCSPGLPFEAGTGSAPMPREGLVLVIVVDQMRADELDRTLPGGIGGLARRGRVFEEALVAHAHTETCPGHAVVLSGRQPGPAGIPGNVFVQRESGETRYCVEDPNPSAALLHGDGGRSPRWLRVSTLGDWMRGVDPGSRVYAVSSKDRAAIMLGGKRAQGVYWFRDVGGAGFTTSRYYQSALPDWLDRFNRRDFFDEAPRSWVHATATMPNGRRDDYPLESDRFSRTSPHPLRLGDDADDAERFSWSPWGDEVVLRLALELIEREDLGDRGHLDMLAVSLSSLDLVGHLYGPESHEALDALRRLDDWLEEFLDEVEDEVEDDRLWVALTSDHGVTPIPEWLAETGRSRCPIPGGRADSRELAARLNDRLEERFTPADGEWVQRSGYRFTVNRSFAAEGQVPVAAIVAESEAFLEAQPGVRRVWTADEIQARSGPEPFATLYADSWDFERGGDFEIQPEPTCLFTTYPTGANHGSPYRPDRHVPLVFAGPGVESGRIAGPVATVDLAPTLAAYLGIPAPEGLDGRVLPLRDPSELPSEGPDGPEAGSGH